MLGTQNGNVVMRRSKMCFLDTPTKITRRASDIVCTSKKLVKPPLLLGFRGLHLAPFMVRVRVKFWYDLRVTKKMSSP